MSRSTTVIEIAEAHAFHQHGLVVMRAERSSARRQATSSI
jgi:hypothetical protein